MLQFTQKAVPGCIGAPASLTILGWRASTNILVLCGGGDGGGGGDEDDDDDDDDDDKGH